MKKLSLMIAALALVLGVSQCKKQEKPAASGEKHRIVLTAGHSDNGAKISGDFEGAVMSLKWELGDVILVSGALQGTLDEIIIDPNDPACATFTGTVEEGEGTTVTFSYGEQPNPDDPLYFDGILDGIKANIRSSYLTYTTEVKTSGEYSAEFKLPFAVLKVDVSAIISDVWTMTIKSGDKDLAMVNVAPETSHELYLGIPVAEDAGEVEYTFCGPDQQATKLWDLEPSVFYTAKGADGKPTGEAIVIAPDAPVEPINELCFTAKKDDSWISLDMEGENDLYFYKSSGKGWVLYEDSQKIELNNGEKVYFGRPYADEDFNPEGYVGHFEMGGMIAASGSVMSLISPDCSATEIPCEECFMGLFAGCTNLETAPKLPATTLADMCYGSMFQGCSSLKTAPELPAENLDSGCYRNMFQGCSSLEKAPELPAENLESDCYISMFQECTNLETAPELPAENLADDCYSYMFSACMALETAPELPAVNLAPSCYEGMFDNCMGLIEAPELPATTLVDGCYGQMFMSCNNLKNITNVGHEYLCRRLLT